MEGVSGQARVHNGGGGRGGVAPPPLETRKKMLSEEILTFFTYVLLMKLGGNRYTACKMEGGGRTGACPWWEGVGALPPPRKGKKGCQRKF